MGDAPTEPMMHDDARLIRAAAIDHRRKFRHEALVAGGGAPLTWGTAWTYTTGPHGGAGILFPRWGAEGDGAPLDAILATCRPLPGLRSVSCWMEDAPQPPAWEAMLLARGFSRGWQPHWMARATGALPAIPASPGLRLTLTTGRFALAGAKVPYLSRREADRFTALAAARPRRIWHIVARLDGRVVGHGAVHLPGGPGAVAGIHAVGVAPDARRRGIGAAIMLALLARAAEAGRRCATLNATPDGEALYRALGFRSLGRGQTWWLTAAALAAPPAPATTMLIEAIGRDDPAAVGALAAVAGPGGLDAPLPGGLTPLGIAALLGRPAAAATLLAHGATLDVITAWDLGWRERVPALLAADPALANRRGGREGLTPLHTAVLRDDPDLARLLLAARPDLTLRDATYNSTALGWARHLGREGLVALLEEESE